MTFALPADRVLVVTGALFPRESERRLRREDLATVQVLGLTDRQPVPGLAGWGERGVVALTMLDDGVCLSTGDDLWTIDLADGAARRCDTGVLVDVHELTSEQDVVWIPSTGQDRLLAHDVVRDEMVDEVVLAGGPTTGSTALEDDSFHANQMFRTHDGDLGVLTHHVSGRRVRLAQRVTRQGDGGVLVPVTGISRDLGLRGPHSVRPWRDGYLVCDSGAATLNEYGPDWSLRRHIEVAGWGRGLVVHGDRAWIGVSTVRHRYGDLFGGRHVPNQVQEVDLSSGDVTATVELHDVEQVNSVELVTTAFAERLLSLPAR